MSPTSSTEWPSLHTSATLSIAAQQHATNTHLSRPLLVSTVLLGLQQTAVVTSEGSRSFEKYSFPTRCKSSIVTRDKSARSFLEDLQQM